MREMLREELGRSLKALPDLDRLQAAWTVACGKIMAERGQILSFEDGIVLLEAEDGIWLGQMRSMAAVLQSDLARIAGVNVAAIHFSQKRDRRSQPE